MTKTPAELLVERTKRMTDAYAMRIPDRVPIVLNFNYMLARLGGITNQELEEDHQKAQALLEKWAHFYEPDVAAGISFGFRPQPSLILGDRQTQWPGHGVDPMAPFQFVEGEYMKAEEYDAFIDDPTDFTLRKFLPRAFGALEALADLPRLAILLTGYSAVGITRAFSAAPVMAAFEALARAGKQVEELGAAARASAKRMEALGFPTSLGTSALVSSPFDFLSDTLRGMRGIMLDMYRCPDKLLAAEEKVIPIAVDYAVAAARRTGNRYCSVPLHRGSDGFMSIKQFETFYWPQLKAMLLGMIDGGVTPSVFWEGCYDGRLHYLRELPKGRVIGRFDRSNLFKVKEMLGDTMCIQAGFPVSLLQAGSPEQVRALTKELCEVVGKDGGFIMGTNSAMNDCNAELVKAWVDATKEYGVYN